jgi:hypothetical protein
MNTGYPAIVTPQLREGCSEFEITEDQESWIGKCVAMILIQCLSNLNLD